MKEWKYWKHWKEEEKGISGPIEEGRRNEPDVKSHSVLYTVLCTENMSSYKEMEQEYQGREQNLMSLIDILLQADYSFYFLTRAFLFNLPDPSDLPQIFPFPRYSRPPDIQLSSVSDINAV